MKVLNTQLLDEVRQFFDCEWEEYSYKSAKVKAIKKEMDDLVQKIYSATELARLNEDYARSVVGLKTELRKKHQALLDAIEAEKKREAEAAHKEKLASVEKQRLGLAEEANKLSKSAQSLSKISMGLTLLLGAATICLQLYLNLTKEDRLKQQIVESVSVPLQKEISDLKSTTAGLNEKVSALSIENQKISEKVAMLSTAKKSKKKEKK